MLKFTKRNLASTVEAMSVTTDEALWTEWTLAKAVKDGYKESGWVYKAVSMISKNAATAPFVVKNAKNEIQWNHPVTQLLLNPHPVINRVQFYELLIQWLQLAGSAYMKKADASGGNTKELWPISPDRIAPIESKDNSLMLDGYSVKKSSNGIPIKSDEFTTENVIQINLTNPAQPLIGISPLQAVAKTVDADNAQQDWNVAAMQNRGVVEGVFTFKQPLDKTQADSILKRIMNKFTGSSNARKPLVIGSDATYTKMSLTPAEMDFLKSRNFNRDEIFVVFGVPPQLGGSQESATYNNFAESMRIFWNMTLIPLLKLMATQYTSSFADQLSEGEYIDNDFTGISALRDNDKEKAEVADLYYNIGIPVSQINTKLELGFEAYEGWDLSFNGKQPNAKTQIQNGDRAVKLIPLEQRDGEAEAAKRDKIAEGPAADAYADLLKRQGDAVFAALERNEDPIDASRKFIPEWQILTGNVMLSVAAQFAETTVITERGRKLDFSNRGELENELIRAFMLEEQLILSEVSLIDEATTRIILDQVRNASEKGFDFNALRKALEDTGVFSPERALRIARTEVGTAASIGQFASAKVAGAGHKTWQISGTNTREAHNNRSGEEVGIDERFSAQISTTAPRFPLDPQMNVADRVNCDCFMTFRVDN